MVDQPNNRQEEDIKELFSLFDVDGSGTISTHELDTAMRCMGKIATEADRSEVEDDNGNITLSKFLGMMKRKLKEEECEEEILEAFRVFDKEGYGIVSAAQLRQAMTSHGGNLTVQEADDILTEAGIDKVDGQVDYTDLVQLITSQ